MGRGERGEEERGFGDKKVRREGDEIMRGKEARREGSSGEVTKVGGEGGEIKFDGGKESQERSEWEEMRMLKLYMLLERRLGEKDCWDC